MGKWDIYSAAIKFHQFPIFRADNLCLFIETSKFQSIGIIEPVGVGMGGSNSIIDGRGARKTTKTTLYKGWEKGKPPK